MAWKAEGEDGIGAWNDMVDIWRLKCDMACDKERYSVLADFGV